MGLGADDICSHNNVSLDPGKTIRYFETSERFFRVFKKMTSSEERGAEALQALVTPATFEEIATQLEEAQREKQRVIDQRVRISQEKSSARIVGQPELATGARANAMELSRKAQKKYLNMIHVRCVSFV